MKTYVAQQALLIIAKKDAPVKGRNERRRGPERAGGTGYGHAGSDVAVDQQNDHLDHRRKHRQGDGEALGASGPEGGHPGNAQAQQQGGQGTHKEGHQSQLGPDDGIKHRKQPPLEE